MIFFRKKRTNKQYMISVGAGINQIPLIKKIHECGFKVIGIDINSNARGLQFCDLKINESTANYKGIIEKIDELMLDGEILGALSRSYGESIKTASLLNELFNKNYIPSNIINDFNDKKRMKSLFKTKKIPTPETNELVNIKSVKTYPIVVKPLRGHAKQGVLFIKKPDDLKKYIAANKNEDNIWEPFIEGSEIISYGLVINGKYTLICISDKKLTKTPFFVDTDHIVPSKFERLSDEINSIGEDIAKAYSIHTSPLIIEMRIDKNDSIFVMEAVPEFGGEYLAEYLIPEFTGIDVFKEIIWALNDPSYVFRKRIKKKGSVIVHYILGNAGSCKSFDENVISKNVIYHNMFIRSGDLIKKAHTNHDRIGVIIAKGKNTAKTSLRVEEYENALHIEINRK